VATGWKTTDEDERLVRRKRAKSGDFKIEKHSKKADIFDTYSVNDKYTVELRSLDDEINSCSCPDFEANGLGTCKHIEAVKLQYDGLQARNKKIEIFLDTHYDTVKIRYPRGSRKESVYREILDPFFDASLQLLSDPLYSIPALKRELSKLDKAKSGKVRLSAHIDKWLKRKIAEREREIDRENYLQDFKKGKRSLDFLKHSLYPYQKEGVLHLAFTKRALLADEMGLGKTIQAIGASVLLKRLKGIRRVLVISPASLKGEWEEQINKFTNESICYVHGSKPKRDQIYHSDAFFYLANYEQIPYDFEEINRILQPDLVVLDEAQRIKNWRTKTANSIKKLQSEYAFVLTGTPLENNIDEIYSIVQFLDPFIFGPLFRFNRNFYKLNDRGMAEGYQNLKLLYRTIKPVMLRRKKEDIEGSLPPRTLKNYFVPMTQEQRKKYEEYEQKVSRLASKAAKYPLKEEELKKLQMWLSCMRMLCDSGYILDEKLKQSPKLDELIPILEEIMIKTKKKVILFSEWERMLFLLRERLEDKEWDFAFHSGSKNQKERRSEIERFKNDSNCRLFLSTDSGSVGLNLQAASVVINLDIPWNPAKLEQRIARAWRKHQLNSVQVINLVTENSIENKMLYLIKQKQNLSDSAIDGSGEDSQPIARNRKEFIDRIKEIYGEGGPPRREKLDLKAFTQDLLSRYEERVEKVARNRKGTLLVVIDKKDDVLSDVISDLGNKKVELLSREEFALLKKLESLGMIAVDKKLEYLFDKHTPVEKPSKTKLLKKTLRKIKKEHKLISLLEESGFKKEALKAYCKNALKMIKYLLLYNGKKKKITVESIKDLKSRYLFDDTFDVLVKHLQKKCQRKNSDTIENFYGKLFKIVLSAEV